MRIPAQREATCQPQCKKISAKLFHLSAIVRLAAHMFEKGDPASGRPLWLVGEREYVYPAARYAI